VSDVDALFGVLRQSTGEDVVAAFEHAIREAPDRLLNRINVFDFAVRYGIDEERVIAGFLHASRLGIFEMSWAVLCPACGNVLASNATLKTVEQAEHNCALCAAGYEPTLDEMVEVTFTVSRRVRKIAAHEPDDLSLAEYFRQVVWSSGMAFTEDEFEQAMHEIVIDSIELAPGEKASLSLQLPAAFVIVMEPVSHAAHFFDVKGEPERERQTFSIVYNNVAAPTGTTSPAPGPFRLSFENRTARRVLPSVWIAGDELHRLLGGRKPFLTAKRLLTNQTFRDVFHTDTLEIDQRLKILSMTFLFTDLKASTALYERVGDLVAYDLVREHFKVLYEIVAAETGAVVKTIGDAVMATFPTPDRGLAAALRMRSAMQTLNDQRGNDDLLLKIGLHEGPCLAVTLNDQQDYFGQTVNVAARVQGLADSRAIFATGSIVEHPQAAMLLKERGLTAHAQRRSIRGVVDDMAVYEIP